MIELTLQEAEDFVQKNKGRGYRWDGWTIVKWVKNPVGYTMPNGAMNNGTWGVQYRTNVSDDGKWRIKRV